MAKGSRLKDGNRLSRMTTRNAGMAQKEYYPETGELCAVKVAGTVRRGVFGKVPA
jgi:hypothetical protein